jgi:outer membrane protein assembly factor BamB
MYALSTVDGSVQWKYQTLDIIDSTATLRSDGSLLYFGSNDKIVYSLNSTGDLQWRYQTGGEVGTKPLLSSDGTVYAASGDGYLYTLRHMEYPTGTVPHTSPLTLFGFSFYILE